MKAAQIIRHDGYKQNKRILADNKHSFMLTLISTQELRHESR